MTFTELLALDQKTTNPTPPAQPAKADTTISRHHAITPSRQREGTQVAKGDGATPRRHDAKASRGKGIEPPATPAALIARLRAAVKPLGKEVSTHRFTAAEKERLTELVYRYERRGYRTSENEMVRVAVNAEWNSVAAGGPRRPRQARHPASRPAGAARVRLAG